MKHRCAVCDRDVGVYPAPRAPRPRGVTLPAAPTQPGRFMRHRFTGDAPVSAGLSAGDWCPGSGAPVPPGPPPEPGPSSLDPALLAAGWQFLGSILDGGRAWVMSPTTPPRAGGPFGIIASA